MSFHPDTNNRPSESSRNSKSRGAGCKEPLVSVVLPTYNRSRVLMRAVASVLNQDYTNIELIIVDDGSTDNTCEIIKSVKDKRIIYIAQQNQGANAARNKGVSESRGMYVAFQDSDDYWRPGKLTKQVKSLIDTRADFSICRMLSHKPNQSTNLVPSKKQLAKGLTLQTLLRENFISTQALVVRKELIQHVQFDNAMPRLQDWDLAIRLFQYGRLSYVNEVLVDQYIQSDSTTMNPNKLIRAYKKLIYKYKEIYEKYPEAASAIYSGLSGAYIACENYDEAVDSALTSLKYKANIKAVLRLAYSKIKYVK